MRHSHDGFFRVRRFRWICGSRPIRSSASIKHSTHKLSLIINHRTRYACHIRQDAPATFSPWPSFHRSNHTGYPHSRWHRTYRAKTRGSPAWSWPGLSAIPVVRHCACHPDRDLRDKPGDDAANLRLLPSYRVSASTWRLSVRVMMHPQRAPAAAGQPSKRMGNDSDKDRAGSY